jgi:hypothetical protein
MKSARANEAGRLNFNRSCRVKDFEPGEKPECESI